MLLHLFVCLFCVGAWELGCTYHNMPVEVRDLLVYPLNYWTSPRENIFNIVWALISLKAAAVNSPSLTSITTFLPQLNSKEKRRPWLQFWRLKGWKLRPHRGSQWCCVHPGGSWHRRKHSPGISADGDRWVSHKPQKGLQWAPRRPDFLKVHHTFQNHHPVMKSHIQVLHASSMSFQPLSPLNPKKISK